MNDYLNTALQPLIEKVYNEGIEKAKVEARQIISEAKRQASEIMEDAKRQIAGMESQSLTEMSRKKENLDRELKSVTQQTLSNIKNELVSVISNKIPLKGFTEILNDRGFLQKLILTVIQKWSAADNNLQFQLILNKEDEAQIGSFIEQGIKNALSKELEILIDNKIRSGFKIGIKNGNYYVSFTDHDFENFFNGYLRDKIFEWVYGNKRLTNE